MTPPSTLRRRTLLAGLAALSGAAAFAQAAPWPNRVVKFLVPSPPGGPADLFARLFGDHCATTFGQPFVVENRPGATGAIALQALTHSAPDGYTFLIGSNSTFVVTPLVQKNAPSDFAPAGIFTSYPALLLARPDAPFRNIPALIAYAKQQPGKLNYASFGVGSLGHLTNELFCQLAGVKVQHVNYPGTAAVLQALARGEADYAFDSYGNAKPFIDSGKAIPLAVSSGTRDRRLPQLPTMAEAGFPQIDARIWLGFVAPAGTPAPILARFNAELMRYADLPETKQRLETTFSDPMQGTLPVMAERLAAERKLWGGVVREAKIAVE